MHQSMFRCRTSPILQRLPAIDSLRSRTMRRNRNSLQHGGNRQYWTLGLRQRNNRDHQSCSTAIINLWARSRLHARLRRQFAMYQCDEPMPDRKRHVPSRNFDNSQHRIHARNLQLLATWNEPYNKGDRRIRRSSLCRMVRRLRFLWPTPPLSDHSHVLRRRMAIPRQIKRNRTDMSKAEDILFFDVIFLLMVFTFSASASNASDLS